MPHDTILAEPATTQGLRHAPTTIALHWITAALVGLIWCIGQTVDFAPDGALRVDYRSLHITLGLTLAVVLLLRLAWRATAGGMLPPEHTGPLLAIARITHWVLYALLLLAIALGIANMLLHGTLIFNLFTVGPLTRDHGLRRAVGGWHALAANAVMIVAGLHAAAALFHHYVLRDATLRRMIPWELP